LDRATKAGRWARAMIIRIHERKKMYPLWESSQQDRESISEGTLWTWVVLGTLVNLIFLCCIWGFS
jgi:hypothetical protein